MLFRIGSGALPVLAHFLAEVWLAGHKWEWSERAAKEAVEISRDTSGV